MRALVFLLVLLSVISGCAHRPEIASKQCPKCGAALFFADPGITTREDISEFAMGSKLKDRDRIIADGWIHPGAYCPNGDYSVLYSLKRP
jgi:hypothetical protein